MSFTLKQARLYRGKTQVETAQAIGVSPSTYRRYEANPRRFPLGLLNRFSKVVNIPRENIDVAKREEEPDVQSD